MNANSISKLFWEEENPILGSFCPFYAGSWDTGLLRVISPTLPKNRRTMRLFLFRVKGFGAQERT